MPRDAVLTGVADDTLRYSVVRRAEPYWPLPMPPSSGHSRRIELPGHASSNPTHLGSLDYEVLAACQGVSQRFYGGLIHAPTPETTGYLRKKSTLVIGTGTKPSAGALAAL